MDADIMIESMVDRCMRVFTGRFDQGIVSRKANGIFLVDSYIKQCKSDNVGQ
jgi:hypothetical protein